MMADFLVAYRKGFIRAFALGGSMGLLGAILVFYSQKDSDK